MSNSTTTVNTGGIGFFGLLGLLFVGLKLTGHISWSWFWVTVPLWGPASLALVISLIFFAVYIIKA